MSDRLLPCPFCHGDAELEHTEGCRMSWVVCTECGATTQKRIGVDYAIGMWNLRGGRIREWDCNICGGTVDFANSKKPTISFRGDKP